jgi:hypothetical protein
MEQAGRSEAWSRRGFLSQKHGCDSHHGIDSDWLSEEGWTRKWRRQKGELQEGSALSWGQGVPSTE